MKNDTFFTVPFPRNTYFVGREAELDALHNALTANGQGQVGINPAGLTGMGGIGKTQLAVEYCYRALAAAHFPDGIFWLNAAFPLREEFSKLGQKLIGLDGLLLPQMQMRKLLVKYFNISELQDLCLELGVNHEEIAGHNDTISSFARGLIQFCQQRNRLPELLNHCFQNRPKVMWPKPWEDEPEQTRSQDDWIGAAFDYLQAHPNSLLVLDNLPDPLTLTQSLGREWVPANLPGALMFTTRSGELYHFTPVPLKVLPEDAALKLLLRHPARQSFQQAEYPEHETAREICQMVGYLPLALEVAGAQLGARPALKLAAYRRTLHKQGALPVIENKRLPVQTAHETGLQAVLMEQWAQLPSDEARLLLRVAAAFEEAAQLPAARLGLMAGLPDEAEDFFEDITLAETLRQLVAASLLELLDKQVMQASDDNEAIEYQDMRLMIRLHPLVREFTMQQPPFSGPLPGVDTKEIGLFCARNLIDAYENFAVLER
ncbi:MAG: ATP-binding protein, partial [Chloroflexi bacterium]